MCVKVESSIITLTALHVFSLRTMRACTASAFKALQLFQCTTRLKCLKDPGYDGALHFIKPIDAVVHGFKKAACLR